MTSGRAAGNDGLGRTLAPLRILYHHRTLADGAEGVHIREMVRALRRLGHDLRIAALVGEPAEDRPRQESRWGQVSRLLPAAAYELAEIGYNVVGRRALDRAAREFKPDFIYDRYNSFSTPALHVARAHGVPLILEVNAPVAYERTAYENKRLWMANLAVRYERHICTSADHVFVVSTPLGRFLINERGVDRHRLTVLPNGANAETFRPEVSGSPVRAALGLGERIVIGFVGILRPWHGVDMLIDALPTLRSRGHDLHLLIVGDGPIEGELQARAEALGVRDRVTFTGRLAHQKVRDHVAAMDVAVSPKATFYASPMKILEYMALAKPVIGPAMDNIRDLIDDGRTGILFEPDDAAALTARLDALLASPERRLSIGLAARHEIERRLNWDRNAAMVVDRAGELLAGEQRKTL